MDFEETRQIEQIIMLEITELQTFLKSTKKMKEKIKEMAEKYGFHDVKYIGKWKKYNVYEPIFTDEETHMIGFPQYLLERNGTVRWAESSDESMDIFFSFLQ